MRLTIQLTRRVTVRVLSLFITYLPAQRARVIAVVRLKMKNSIISFILFIIVAALSVSCGSNNSSSLDSIISSSNITLPEITNTENVIISDNIQVKLVLIDFLGNETSSFKPGQFVTMKLQALNVGSVRFDTSQSSSQTHNFRIYTSSNVLVHDISVGLAYAQAIVPFHINIGDSNNYSTSIPLVYKEHVKNGEYPVTNGTYLSKGDYYCTGEFYGITKLELPTWHLRVE